MKNNLQTWILVIIVLIVIGIGIYLSIFGGKTIKEGGNATGNKSEKINESGEEKIVVGGNISEEKIVVGGNISEEKIVVGGNISEEIGNLTNKSEGIGNVSNKSEEH